MRSLFIAFSLMFLFFQVYGKAQSQEAMTIHFDNTGEESGITTRGTSDFSFMGSNWTGGVVETEGVFSLYASGTFSYEISVGGGVVTFDNPASTVEFFYVHGFGFDSGVATALNSEGIMVASVTSNQATFFGEPNNFVRFESVGPISRIDFSGGVVDSFTYTIAPSPPPKFTRGDCNGEGGIDISDAIASLDFLFGDGFTPCEEACNTNGDGGVDISDPIYLLFHLFSNGPQPPGNFPACAEADPADCAEDICNP